MCLSGSITPDSGSFLPFRLPNRGDIVPSGVFGVFLPSINADSARLLSFRRPNRGDLVSFGSVQRVPALLPPPIPSASIRSGCRLVVILRFQLRLYLIDTHQEIGDMVILHFRVSWCCTLGSILICIFGFYSDPPPPVPLVPVLTGPPNYGNCLLYTSPSPRD